ncbi:M20/M25/M40 family metallo-hydrolase [Pseudonocardia cypriaca]|uniref:Zn-dependent M28 family amino/carboxypeptidase n=1 Tax=Pseudonocardia cypriaca TaxID=882449 RepID=A0A543FMX6_9PSEU|nr:M20/M25/M40 family metallo-hydrolase [Pseudonocardia cypriaca]TQM35151.1 Zn-dependent M28 family amino/carboxypeptidase [Pseudonocardia cypriaca]
MRRVRTLLLVAVTAMACGAPAVAPPPQPAPPAPDPGLPSRLVEEVTGEGAFAHLAELQRIADANGGNRALGTPGYDASVDYVVGVLRGAGYEVQTPTFDARRFEVRQEQLTVDGGPVPVSALGFSPTTPDAGVTGPLTVMAGEGCNPADAGAVTPGSVALVRRGTCPFAQKATHAAGAGALGLIVINTADEPLDDGTLGEAATGVVPTGGVSRSAGDALAGRAGAAVTLTLVTTVELTPSRNVLAQTRSGNPDEVVVAGAHLDSVPEGPGVNDNGSGVATLLETAVRLGANPPVTNAVRFAFWGAEETGLVGSTTYVQGLSEEDRNRIALYINLDMVGSPNAGYLVYDGDDSDQEGDGPGPRGSAAIERALVEGLAAAGVQGAGTDFSGRSDYGPFIARGIPSGGLFTGAEEVKSAEEAQRWGGTAGEAYDRCYHQACDRLDTIDRTAVDRNADAFAAALARFALSTDELAAG